MTFNELCTIYFQIYAPYRLKAITAYNYESTVRRRLLPRLGELTLEEINTARLSAFFCTQLSVELSPSTIRTDYQILKSIMDFAVSQGYLEKTPCSGVILPRDTREKKRRYLKKEELPAFLTLFDGYSVLNTAVKLLLYTGLRCGEMLGLKWNDIDFEKGTIQIVRSLSKVGGRSILSTPKSSSSQRVIFISESLCRLLLVHRDTQLKLQKSAESFSHPEMVFTSETGNYLDRGVLGKSYRQRLAGSPFEFMTLHGLRHSNATLLLNSGVDIKIVSEHLGHKDISITANFYAAVLDSSRRKTAEIMEGIIVKNTRG